MGTISRGGSHHLPELAETPWRRAVHLPARANSTRCPASRLAVHHRAHPAKTRLAREVGRLQAHEVVPPVERTGEWFGFLSHLKTGDSFCAASRGTWEGSCFTALRRDHSRSYLRSTGCHRQPGGPGDVDRRIHIPV